MLIEKIRSLVNTSIKQLSVDSATITDSSKKFDLLSGSELKVNSLSISSNNHWQIAQLNVRWIHLKHRKGGEL